MKMRKNVEENNKSVDYKKLAGMKNVHVALEKNLSTVMEIFNLCF